MSETAPDSACSVVKFMQKYIVRVQRAAMCEPKSKEVDRSGTNDGV
jgi:hypothetical protein